jgi:hypothetical protein
MKKEIEFEELGVNEKELLLGAFGYKVNEDGTIFDEELGVPVFSKRHKGLINIKEVALMPGSLDLLDSDPVTLSEFLRKKVECE